MEKLALNFFSVLHKPQKRSFTNYGDMFLTFLTTYPPYVDISYLINIDKMSTFLDYVPMHRKKR